MPGQPNPVRHVVVTGAAGLLGGPLCRQLASRADVRLDAFAHADLDITDEAFVRARLAELRPDLVINCAAFTRVDDCESQETLAMRVNGHGPANLAAACRSIDALLIHISTDYVFDGSKPSPYGEHDLTGPEYNLSAYGRSKLAGERGVIGAGGRHLIVRTSWLYGEGGPNFVASILRLARARPELSVVNDQRGRPTYAPDLAGAIINLIDAGATGVIHAANSDACTWYEFACEIVRAAGLDTPVRPCTTAEFPRPARRPANSVLDTTRYEKLTGRRLRSWRDAVREYITLLEGTPGG